MTMMFEHLTRRYFRFSVAVLIFLGGFRFAGAQTVGTSISADGAWPNTNAMLDVQSPATGDGRGLLIPRLTENQRTNADVTLPGGLLNNSGNLRGGAAQGLLMYQTDGTQGFYYNTSTVATPAWTYIGGWGTGNGDFMADGSVPMTGRLRMNGQLVTNASAIAFNSGCIAIGNGALCYSAAAGGVAIGDGSTARYRTCAVAIGTEADADYNGIAIGYQSDGQYSNVAIGIHASAYSGYDRIAIGNRVTNRVNDSMAVRGSLYLDGGTGVMVRSTFGSGGWSAKAFTIDHPLDPEHKVLRHFCVEGPEVWNVYAGNAELVNGQAAVELPAYYPALNKAGSEVVSLTPWGKAQVWVQGVDNNRLLLSGDADVKVSWTIKVLRNDPACVEDLKQRPVEQLKSELLPDQAKAETRDVNTGME